MSDIDKIKERLSITDVVSRYVDLKQAGSNLKGVCPFHQEKTPSFMVNPSLQIFKCFGCGKGGDILSFISEIERLEFHDALELAAEWAGVELTGSYHKKDEKVEKMKEKFYEINRLAADFFHHILMSHKIGKNALKYAIEKRKLNSDVLKKFKYGYAPDGYENIKQFLMKKGFSEGDLIESGIIVDRNGKSIDKFRNRLMQPIHDLNGNIVGFSGRYLGEFEGAPKYLNSSETLIYKKNELLYGLYFAKEAIRKEKRVIIVEGNIDIASSHRVGVENIVAPLGTAFTGNQGRLLKRFTEELYFAFDTDNAGIGAVVRGLGIAEDLGLNHKVIDLGDYGDVDDLIRDDETKWPSSIANAVNTVDYLKNVYSRDLDLGSVDGKLTFKKRILPILKLLKNEVLKSHYIKEVSAILDLSRDILLEEVEQSSAPKRNQYTVVEEPQVQVSKNVKVSANEEIEKYLLALAFQSGRSEMITGEVISSLQSPLAIMFARKLDKNETIKISELKEEEVSYYNDLQLIDISDLQSIESELQSVINRLLKMHYESQIKELRRKMDVDSENEELVLQLNQLTKKLAGFK